MGRVQDWRDVRSELEEDFSFKGIERYCEIRFKNTCTGRVDVYFAHSKKRLSITKPKYELHEKSSAEAVKAWEDYEKDIREVIWACNSCHDIIEKYPEEEMTRFVREKIESRQKALDKWVSI